MFRQMIRGTLSLRLIAIAGIALVAGCGGQDAGPPLVPVSGIVTVDGEPFPHANVSFRPDTDRGNEFGDYLPAGVADENGRYELVTTARPGAPEGWYKVVVIAPTPPPGAEAPKVGPPPFNPKYSNPDQTDLEVEVKKDAPAGAYDLKLSK